MLRLGSAHVKSDGAAGDVKQSTPKLWCAHVAGGPDDLYAAENHEAADRMARKPEAHSKDVTSAQRNGGWFSHE